MNSLSFTNIFKSGSRTYFYSSFFFPKDVRDDVTILYAFVRTADDFVDAIPQQKKEFYAFAELYKKASHGGKVNNEIITAFIDLMNRKQIDPAWVDAFLSAMAQDLTKTIYNTIEETEEYMYGSAEVIGLMMAKIMNLPQESFAAAQKLGKAMQYINFIRDINEDIQLGRTYLPFKELKKTGLHSLHPKDTFEKREAFTDYILNQISRYEVWQAEAEKGFHYIPVRFRIPIKTASDMYKYTANQIKKDPLVVYRRKVKPSMYLIIGAGVKNSLEAV